MKILFVTNAAPAALAGDAIALASVRYRATLPAAALCQLGWQAEVVSIEQALDPGFRYAGDAIVLAQPKEDRVVRGDLLPALGGFIQRQREAGIRLLLDVCDLKVGEPYQAQIGGILRDAKQAALCVHFYPALMRVADRIVVPTPVLAQRIAEHVCASFHFSVVGDPVEVAAAPVRFAPQPDAPLRLLWFGFFGAHAPAVAKFCREDLPRMAAIRPVEFTLLCEANAARHRDALAALAGPGVALRFAPWSVPALEVALAACDATVFPIDLAADTAVGKSNNRALQALQAGRAVFAHPLASYRELDAYAGIAEDLVPAMADALKQPAACLARTKAGQAHVAAHFSPAAIARQWMDVLTPKP